MHSSDYIRLTSFRSFLVVQLTIPILTLLSAGAQTPNAPATTGSAEAERVIVTGSNIPTAEEVGPNPVLSYNRENIEKSGDRTTEEFLRNLPAASSTGVPVSNN